MRGSTKKVEKRRPMRIDSFVAMPSVSYFATSTPNGADVVFYTSDCQPCFFILEQIQEFLALLGYPSTIEDDVLHLRHSPNQALYAIAVFSVAVKFLEQNAQTQQREKVLA
jgi:hypothetical protein